MPKTVTGGTVYRQGQSPSLAAAVESIYFPDVASGITVPIGATGTMLLQSPPPQIGHYDTGDVLYYQDSNNNNNNATFSVLANVGPTKYNVQRTG